MLALLLWGCGDPRDPLERAGLPVSTGAATGYIPDTACAGCHAELYASYQQVGMARSFYRPSAERMIENFGAEPFFHPVSERYYRMRRDGERLLFERYQLDREGEPIHHLEVEIDYILGSGHTSRTYLFQTPAGELYQLPIAWYSQPGRWGMAPGFDNDDHSGVGRRVRQECMFCHNAYPEVPAGSDAYGAAQTFPAELPEGIGCQRCHGPGAEHVRAALARDEAALRSSIVDPDRLPPERAADVCYGCHYQPTVAIAGVRRFGRGVYSFRPGEALEDYLAPIDVEVAGQSRDQRFEINHHPYRLEQSRCFIASEPGALACTRCHDPHRKVPAAERKTHYRDACLSCHQPDACALDEMADEAAALGLLGEVEVDDCASCHMPRRRTQDVVQVVMTDHRIVRRPAPAAERLAPLAESTPVLTDAAMIRPHPEIDPSTEAIYRAVAVLRAGPNAAATEFLAAALASAEVTSPEPLLDLVRGLLREGRVEEAEAVATRVLERWPDLVQARTWRALARVRLGALEEALDDLTLSLAADGERPETLVNQGLTLFALERHAEAAEVLRRAVELGPNSGRGWTYLGRALVELGETEEAEHAYRRALAIDPLASEATLELGRLLARQGREQEARRILEHGVRHVREPLPVVRALLELGADSPDP